MPIPHTSVVILKRDVNMANDQITSRRKFRHMCAQESFAKFIIYAFISLLKSERLLTFKSKVYQFLRTDQWRHHREDAPESVRRARARALTPRCSRIPRRTKPQFMHELARKASGVLVFVVYPLFCFCFPFRESFHECLFSFSS